jgi:hypothetical protein
MSSFILNSPREPRVADGGTAERREVHGVPVAPGHHAAPERPGVGDPVELAAFDDPEVRRPCKLDAAGIDDEAMR